MRREELALVILGELDESFIDEAMPKKAAFSAGNDTAGVQHPEMIKEVAEVSKRDVRIYWITRALGMATVVALIVGAVVLLVQNWDKIAVSGNERPGTLTSATEPAESNESIVTLPPPPDYDSMSKEEKLAAQLLKGLHWRMDPAEIQLAASEYWGRTEPSRIHREDSDVLQEYYNVISYDDVEFYGEKANIALVVFDNAGLKSIEYQVRYDVSDEGAKSADEMYERIRADFINVLGEPDYPDLNGWDFAESKLRFDVYKPDNWIVEVRLDDTSDLYGEITDTSMPDPYDDEYVRHIDFTAQWESRFYTFEPMIPQEKREKYYELMQDPSVETPYTITDNWNILSCVRRLELDWNDTKEILRSSQVLSDEDIQVIDDAMLLSDGSAVSALIEHYRSPYAVVGDFNGNGYRVFSPMWLYYHTIEDYKATGIDPYSMHSLLEKYSELGLSEEAWRAFRRKLILYAYSEMYPEKDRVYTYELDVSEPLGDDAFRIFEDMFCGEWEYAGKYDHHDATFDMTYGGTSFRSGRIFGIFETDEIYVIRYNDGGGVLECYVIEKSSPDIMYNTDVLTSLGGIEEIKLGDDEWVKYINRKPAAAELKPGDLSIPGLTYLFHLYGSDFEDYYRAVIERDSYQSISEDENLYIGNGHVLDDFRRYLVDMSENSVVLALPYVHDTQTAHHTPVYYELTFTKDESGEWSVTYNRSGEVYFYERADSKTYTGYSPDYYEGLLPELEMQDVLRVGESQSFRSAVVALRAPDGKVRASCPFASGMVGLSGYSCTAVREPFVQLFNLENRRILISVGLPLWKSEFDRSYLTSFYLYDGDPILSRVEADGDYLEVIVKDSTGISPGEDGTIYCTQPDGLRLEYHIGENGHAALTPSQYD